MPQRKHPALDVPDPCSEAGQVRLSGDVEWEANSTEVGALKSEIRHLKPQRQAVGVS